MTFSRAASLGCWESSSGDRVAFARPDLPRADSGSSESMRNSDLVHPVLGETFEGRALRRFPSDDFLDFARQFDVVPGDRVHAERLELHGDLRVANRQVGMMVGCFRKIADRAD